jgi:biopolymer transport protein ExbB
MAVSVFEYLRGGGLVNGLIFAVCVVVLYVGVGKAMQLWWVEHMRRAAARGLGGGRTSERLRSSRLWHALTGEGPSGAERAEKYYRNRLRELLLGISARLDTGFDTMAAWVSVAPLLGLLGTVVGMIRTFAIIMEFGVGNPALLSEGISVSLLTTEAGLLVAFPGLLFHSVLNGKRNAVIRRIVADGEKLVATLSEECGHAR